MRYQENRRQVIFLSLYHRTKRRKKSLAVYPEAKLTVTFLIPSPLAAGLEVLLNTPPRHSRENGNPGGGVQGVIESSRPRCLPFWIPPYRVRGRLNQARNDTFKHFRYPVRLRRGSSFFDAKGLLSLYRSFSALAAISDRIHQQYHWAHNNMEQPAKREIDKKSAR